MSSNRNFLDITNGAVFQASISNGYCKICGTWFKLRGCIVSCTNFSVCYPNEEKDFLMIEDFKQIGLARNITELAKFE